MRTSPPALRVAEELSEDRPHIQRFAVRYEYPVWFTSDLFDPVNRVLADAITRMEPDRRHRFVVFIDDGVAKGWPGLPAKIAAYAARHHAALELLAAPETVPGGEAAKKNPALVESLQRRLLDLEFDRHSFVVAIGGGAVLDTVGYVAATTHRGIRLIRVPTTVLAQNDSGIGVKNGVNAFGVKNFAGTFAPPFAVINDIRFIETLSARDKIAGIAESVKVALIRDEAFYHWLDANVAKLCAFDHAAMSYMIRRGAELHMHQIAYGGDPFETGSARPLDYGHWSAHKLEVLTGHALRHGEAVAIGMALDARYSAQTGLLAAGQELRICGLLERLGFRLWHPAMEITTATGRPVLLEGLREFREHLGGELTVTLLTGIGHGVEVHRVDEAEMLRAVDWLKARDAAR
ncbi:MAG: 3-dehydroquinate synthase [Kiloniellaceae bacterium]